MSVSAEGFLETIISPWELIEKRMKYIIEGVDDFADLFKTNNLILNLSKIEQTTGLTNLLVTICCLFSIVVLFFIRTKKPALFIRKFIMMFFYSVLSIGTLTGFFVHTFTLAHDAYNGLWSVLYGLLIFAAGIRFYQAFIDIGYITGFISLPFIIITGYIDLIACWYFDMFICIGVYVILFGVILCLTHFGLTITRGVHYLAYIVSDLVVVASMVVQANDFKIGNWDKNSFFHLGVAIYVLFNTVALIIVTLCERNKEENNGYKKLDDKESKEKDD